jgi:hypothetical protein
MASPTPRITTITSAFTLLTTDPILKPLHQAIKDDESENKQAEIQLWLTILRRVFPPTSNYKVELLDLVIKGIPLPYEVIEVIDLTPHPKTGAESEEVLLAIHIWNSRHENNIFRDVESRRVELASYWICTRGGPSREPDSISVTEEGWEFGSGVRKFDRRSGWETLKVEWILTGVFDIKSEVRLGRRGRFERQLDSIDRFLASVKGKRRGWVFEDAEWAFEGMEVRRRVEMKRMIALFR